MLRVAVVLGTRPEAIKLAPVIGALKSQVEQFHVATIAAGQHGAVLNSAVHALGLEINHWLDVLTPGQPLWRLKSRLMDTLGVTFDTLDPGLVIVQGDTQSAVAGAMAGALRQSPVAHIEAGLRSGNIAAPFPEELNRRTIAQLAQIHFAPTREAALNLQREGVPDTNIVITGNTVVDALAAFRPRADGERPVHRNRARILVTTHRRESWGDAADDICAAVRDLTQALPDAEITFILPTSPELGARISRAFVGVPSVRLCAPLAYPDFLRVLAGADLAMTDSGGVQEEAATLGVPTVVMRNETDRPENLDLPHVHLAGTKRAQILGAARDLLNRQRVRPNARQSPFGDGRAAERICEALLNWKMGRCPLLEGDKQFGGHSEVFEANADQLMA